MRYMHGRSSISAKFEDVSKPRLHDVGDWGCMCYKSLPVNAGAGVAAGGGGCWRVAPVNAGAGVAAGGGGCWRVAPGIDRVGGGGAARGLGEGVVELGGGGEGEATLLGTATAAGRLA